MVKKHLSKLVAGVLVTLGAGSIGFAQEVVDPADVGMDAKVLQGITDIVQEAMDSRTMSGANVLVARHGQIVYFESFGKMAEDKPMSKDAIFRHFSSTKPFAAVALLTLVDQGKVRLTDKLSKWWPSCKDMRVADFGEGGKMTLVPATREITVHDILTHTSGFFSGVYRLACSFGAVPQPICEMWAEAQIKAGTFDGITDIRVSETMDKLARMPLMAQPGEKWVYSDMNCNTALAIVEKVTGMRADSYMGQVLFDPLNMQDSWFYLPESVHDRVATTYYGRDGNEGQKGDVYTCDSVAGCEEGDSDVDFSFKTDGEFIAGGSGLHSTTYDFFRFAQMLLNGGELGGIRVLSEEMAHLMTTGQTGDLKDDKGYEHGYMVSVQSQDRPSVRYYGGKGAYGWGGYLGTEFLNDPKDDTILIFMSQTWLIWDVWPYTERIAYLLNRAIVN